MVYVHRGSSNQVFLPCHGAPAPPRNSYFHQCSHEFFVTVPVSRNILEGNAEWYFDAGKVSGLLYWKTSSWETWNGLSHSGSIVDSYTFKRYRKVGFPVERTMEYTFSCAVSGNYDQEGRSVRPTFLANRTKPHIQINGSNVKQELVGRSMATVEQRGALPALANSGVKQSNARKEPMKVTHVFGISS